MKSRGPLPPIPSGNVQGDRGQNDVASGKAGNAEGGRGQNDVATGPIGGAEQNAVGGIRVTIEESATVERNMTARFAASKDVDASKADLLKDVNAAPTGAGGNITVDIKGDAEVGTNLTADTLFF